MILDYAAKEGRDRLTNWARCKIAGLSVLSMACLWVSAGFIGESLGREATSDVVVIRQVGEPPRRGSSETERRTAMLAAAMSLGGAMICAVSIVRTRNRPESHRWVGC